MALEIFTVILISMLPVFELRGAIPYGIALSNLNVITVFLVSVIANIVIIPVVFFFLDYVHHRLIHIQIYANLFERFVERTKSKAERYTTKYGYIGLALFVAIPLPITGAYTGTLAAWLLGIERKKALLALSVGVIVAGVIVTILTLSGAGIFHIFINNRLANQVS